MISLDPLLLPRSHRTESARRWSPLDSVVSFLREEFALPVCAVPCLEDAEARLNQWIADGKPIELCDELADLGSLAALAVGVSSEGYSFEAFVRPEESGHRPHRFASCVRAIRGGLACESLSMRSSAPNRDLALSALDARLKRPAVPADFIRDYDFWGGVLTDRRLGQNCGIGDLISLFESLLLAD